MIPRDWQAEGADRAAGITPATGARRANPKDEAMRSATIAGSETFLVALIYNGLKCIVTAGIPQNVCCFLLSTLITI